MTEEEMRARIVAEARTWIDTPYHACAGVKGVGVDCAMILVRVYAAVGLIEDFDVGPYMPDWFLHRGEELYRDKVLAHARVVDSVKPGDVVMFRVGRCYAHGAIVTRADPLTLVHASIQNGKVLEEEVDTNPDMLERMETAIMASPIFGGAA